MFYRILIVLLVVVQNAKLENSINSFLERFSQVNKYKSDLYKVISRVDELCQRVTSLEHPVHKHSIRIVSEATTENWNWELINDEWSSYIGSLRPIITGQVKSAEIATRVIVIFLLPENFSIVENASKNFFHQWIHVHKYGHPAGDQFILVGKKQSIEDTWNQRGISKLGNKWGYAVDSNEFVARIEGQPSLPATFQNIDQIFTHPFRIGKNIRGRHLKITGNAYLSPFQFIAGKDEQGNDLYDGTGVRLFEESWRAFNYTYSLYPTQNFSTYGSLLEDNKTWTGIVGNLQDPENDYDAGVALAMQHMWGIFMDYGSRFDEAALVFVTAKPTPELKWQAFLFPFQTTVWFILLICLAITAGSIGFVLYCSKLSTLPSVRITFQIMVEQTIIIPNEIRFIAGGLLLFQIILGTAYKSKVMSFLTFPFTESLPSTFNELAYDDEYKPTLKVLGSFEVLHFKSRSTPTIARIDDKLLFDSDSTSCIATSVVIPKSVCISWFPLLRYDLAEFASPDPRISAIYIASDNALSMPISLPFKKHSSYLEGFNPIIGVFVSAGLCDLWQDDLVKFFKKKGLLNYKKDPTSPMNKKLMSVITNLKNLNKKRPLTLANLVMVFGCHSLVLGVATCVFLCEKMAKKIKTATRGQEVQLITVQTVFLP